MMSDTLNGPYIPSKKGFFQSFRIYERARSRQWSVQMCVRASVVLKRQSAHRSGTGGFWGLATTWPNKTPTQFTPFASRLAMRTE